MIVMSFNDTDTDIDIDISKGVLIEFKKIFTHKTSSSSFKVSKDHSNTTDTMFAYNPITKKLVEIDPDQAWFWKKEWLDGEIQADQEYQSGDYEAFDNLDDFINSL